jgi:hypothetical protein
VLDKATIILTDGDAKDVYIPCLRNYHSFSASKFLQCVQNRARSCNLSGQSTEYQSLNIPYCDAKNYIRCELRYQLNYLVEFFNLAKALCVKRHARLTKQYFTITVVPPYLRVIRFKTYRVYVKPRMTPNAIYNVIFV